MYFLFHFFQNIYLCISHKYVFYAIYVDVFINLRLKKLIDNLEHAIQTAIKRKGDFESEVFLSHRFFILRTFFIHCEKNTLLFEKVFLFYLFLCKNKQYYLKHKL